MSPLVPRRFATACLATFALAAAAPAVADADSILYVKEGNIWLTDSAGARTFQVTATGGWSYASQSDDGSVIVAARDRQLFVLNRNGDVVRELATVIGSLWWQGPFDPQVSPNGQHVAYQYFTTTTGTTQTGVAYANTDGSFESRDLHTGWGYPAWIDDATLMHSDPPNALSMDVIVRGLGQPNNEGSQWFRHDELNLRDGDVRGTRLAFVGGMDGEYLPFYTFQGAPGAERPTYCYHYTGPVGRFESPSFSPDGTQLTWNEGDGIYVGAVGNLEADCERPAAAGTLVVPGGRYPDWSGADVPPARVVEPDPRDPPRDDPRRDPRVVPRDGPRRAPGKLRLTAVKGKLAVALKKGLTVRVRNGRGRVALTATVPAATARRVGLGRKAAKVAGGAARTRNGTATVRLRFTPAAARRLARLRTVTLTISGGGARTTVALKR